ncbi:MAG TPA: MFS transporter [Dongiaceae bacterium]|nr:MFS transporter [Dongiaceae bacterium]
MGDLVRSNFGLCDLIRQPDTFNVNQDSRAFTYFLTARAAATLAYQMTGVAIGWQMYDLTGSPLALGLVGLVQFVPSLLLALYVGHAADRYDRRTIVAISQASEALALLCLAAFSILHLIDRNTILVIVFLLGCARAFEYATFQTLLPALVTQEALPAAIARNASVRQTAVIAGPVLGGFLYAAGSGVVYATGGCLFFLSAAIIARLRVQQRALTAREPATVTSLFAGIAYIRSQPVLLGAISLDLFAVLLGGATALLPIFARDILAVGPWGLGILRSAPAVGALTASLYLARNPLQRRVGKIMFASVALFGAATVVFALSTSIFLSCLALVVLGWSDMISVVIRGALVQLETPDEMRGRVSAVNAVFIGTSNEFGEFESGLTAAWFGAVPAALIGGVGTLAVVALWIYLFPQLVQRERLHNS